MNNQSNIEAVVMKRVRRMHILRMLISSAVFATTLALLALYGLGREVWVARVFENGPQSFFGHALYFVYAFDHTRFVVQALVVICLGSVVYLARESAKLISATLTPAHA